MSEAPTIYSSEPLQVYLDDAAEQEAGARRRQRLGLRRRPRRRPRRMVCNLTRGREKFADVEDEIVVLVAASEAARGRLEQLLQEDTTAYNGVITAYKMPKETAEEQAARKAAVQDGLIIAADVPLEICRAAV